MSWTTTNASSSSNGPTLEQVRDFIRDMEKRDWAVRIITSPYIEGYLRVRFATPISGRINSAFTSLSGLPVEIDWDGSVVSSFQANVVYRSGKVEVLDLRPEWMKLAKMYEMIPSSQPKGTDR